MPTLWHSLSQAPAPCWTKTLDQGQSLLHPRDHWAATRTTRFSMELLQIIHGLKVTFHVEVAATAVRRQ